MISGYIQHGVNKRYPTYIIIRVTHLESLKGNKVKWESRSPNSYGEKKGIQSEGIQSESIQFPNQSIIHSFIHYGAVQDYWRSLDNSNPYFQSFLSSHQTLTAREGEPLGWRGEKRGRWVEASWVAGVVFFTPADIRHGKQMLI